MAWLLLALGALLAGCVERRMLIRSEPPGAPVWVDEEYAGVTPLEYGFSFYGYRGVRVGPIRDENEKVKYLERETVVQIKAPWYETFPIDFFFEVLYPGRMTDVHVLPVFLLQDVAEVPPAAGQPSVEALRQRAKEFRDTATYSIPEASPPQ